MIGLAAAPLLCILDLPDPDQEPQLLDRAACRRGRPRLARAAATYLRGSCSGAGLAGLALVVALAAVGLATGRLDREVLTQSPLSMRYRWEYWQGAWGVITEGATAGRPRVHRRSGRALGPGNFGSHYLLHKLPQSSEEIQDPHDLFLEVWATAGFWALLALVAALALAFWNLLGPAVAGPGEDDRAARQAAATARRGSTGNIADRGRLP